jgi:AraC family transcriptional activator of mtrCDE
MQTLETRFIALFETVVRKHTPVTLKRVTEPRVLVGFDGSGTIQLGEGPPIPFNRATVVIIPPKCAARLEVGDGQRVVSVAYATFDAIYASSIPLFGALTAPVVEHFGASDRVVETFRACLDELDSRDVGAVPMTSAMLKQVMVTLLRRARRPHATWGDCIGFLRDPQVARAFVAMLAAPGAIHTVTSLAAAASLSRSSFTARFQEIAGASPMAMLRNIRMRRAAELLADRGRSISYIASEAGYESRSSFVRAFRKTFGRHPSNVRATTLRRA